MAFDIKQYLHSNLFPIIIILETILFFIYFVVNVMRPYIIFFLFFLLPPIVLLFLYFLKDKHRILKIIFLILFVLVSIYLIVIIIFFAPIYWCDQGHCHWFELYHLHLFD